LEQFAKTVSLCAIGLLWLNFENDWACFWSEVATEHCYFVFGGGSDLLMEFGKIFPRSSMLKFENFQLLLWAVPIVVELLSEYFMGVGTCL